MAEQRATQCERLVNCSRGRGAGMGRPPGGRTRPPRRPFLRRPRFAGCGASPANKAGESCDSRSARGGTIVRQSEDRHYRTIRAMTADYFASFESGNAEAIETIGCGFAKKAEHVTAFR